MLQLLPFVLIIVVFYFLLIRPQQRRAKETREQQRNVKPGDKVMLTSGILGEVTAVNEDDGHIDVEIAEDTVITVVRQAIGQLLTQHEDSDESDEDESDDEDNDADEASTASSDAVETKTVEPTQDPGVIVELGKSKKGSSN